MNRFSVLLAIAGLAASQMAAATSDTTRVALVIPVSCALDVVGGQVAANRLTLTVHRRCNTNHVVLIEADDQLGVGATMRFNGISVPIASGFASLPQSERYFDGFDTIVIEKQASEPEMQTYLAHLRLGIEQA